MLNLLDGPGEELAHIVMEAEKSHNKLSASWKVRKANDEIQSCL